MSKWGNVRVRCGVLVRLEQYRARLEQSGRCGVTVIDGERETSRLSLSDAVQQLLDCQERHGDRQKASRRNRAGKPSPDCGTVTPPKV